MNPSFSPDLLSDLRELLAYRFMVSALEAGAIVAVLAAVVGWYAVLRRQAFAGHTLSVMAFPGATGGALAGLPGALGYYLACAAAALAIAAGGRRRGGELGETAAIGTIQATGLAAGFLFLSLSSSVLEGPETILFGSFLGVTQGQVLALLGVAVATLVVVGAIARPLLLATLDPDLARARGVPVAQLEVVFLLLLAVAVAATSQVTGVLLTFALLIAPPAAAQQLTSRPLAGLALSIGLALAIVWLALAAAYFTIYPVGFYATTLAFAAYVSARSVRPLRDRRS